MLFYNWQLVYKSIKLTEIMQPNRLIISVTFLFFLQSFAFASTPAIDSLVNVLNKKVKIDTSYVNTLNKISDEYFKISLTETMRYAQKADSIAESIGYIAGKAEAIRLTGRYYWRISDFVTAREYFDRAFELFNSVGDERGMSKCYNNFGNIYHSQSNLDKALEYYQKSLEVDERLGEKRGMSIAYNNIGVIYRDSGNNEKALEYFLKALKVRQEINDKNGISMSYNNIGIIYQVQGDYPKALEYYQKSLMIKEELGDINGLASTFNNIGVIYRSQGEQDKALEHYQKALEIRLATGDKNGISSSYNNMAIIYRNKKENDKALEYHQKALELRKEINDKAGMAMSYNNIALMYLDVNDFSKAADYYNKALQLALETGITSTEGWVRVGMAQLYLKQGLFQKSFDSALRAYNISRKVNEIDLIHVCADVLAKSAAGLNKFDIAYNYHVVYKNISDSIQNDANTKKIIGMEYEYRYQKEMEITRIEQEKNEEILKEELLRHKNIRNSLFIGFLLVLMLFLVLLYAFIQRRKTNRLLALKKSFEFKQNFLANMSHEIRTPLIGIVGMIEVLQKTKLNDNQQDFINTLKQSSENLQIIINHILDYSKIEEGNLTLNKEAIRFKNLIINAQELFDNISDKNIEFEVISDISIPTLICADQNRIMQVINNLISNAVKYTAEGKVSLKAKLLSKDFIKNEIEIKIEVVDSGQGISKERQKHLFVPFSQIDKSDIRNNDGAGLGLSICKEIVSRHGGQIGYETELNKGSTFWFTFMADMVSEKDYSESNYVEDSFRYEKSLNILFVEDKATTQKVVKLILNSMGHNVVTADNGQHALEVYKPGEFDLILMDIQMPVMDGVTATQKLKEMYKDIPPIVALSANAFEGAREKYIKLGMDEYLAKPLDDEEFKVVVKKLV